MSTIPKEVLEFCEIYGLTTDQFYGRSVYPGDLELWDVAVLPGVPHLKSERDMFFGALAEIPQGGTLEAGGSLFIRSPQLVSLEGVATVGESLSLIGCTSLRSLRSPTLKSVGRLDLEKTPIYSIPEDLEVRHKVCLGDSKKYESVKKAKGILKDFRDSIKCSDDAGEILLDRLNRPLWQIAYATDYLNGDLQL